MGSESSEGNSGEPIGSDEIILKRLPQPFPGNPETTIDRPGIGLTATSFALGPRPVEEFPSWSRQELTSPERLLELLHLQGIDSSGWSVAAVSVGQIRELGLDVIADPTSDDPGHCLVVPTAGQAFTGKIWSKLAKRARVIWTCPQRES